MILSCIVIDKKGITRMLFSIPILDENEQLVLGQIRELRDRLQLQLGEPRRWYGALRRQSFARALRGSNSIEGFDAALDDAAAIADGEAPLDASKETEAAYAGYRDAMRYVLQLASDPDFTYSEQLIKSLHFMMTSYDLKNRPGLWRPGAVWVRDDSTGEVVYEGADTALVPDLIHELVDSLNSDIDSPVLLRAGMAHLNLVMIHPFRDGNGRMARCLQSLVIARGGVLSPVFMSIEEYLGRNTPAYYAVLQRVGGTSWQPGRNARPWVRFILTAHLRQARTVLRRVRESERLWDDLEKLAQKTRVPDRSIGVLFDAAWGFRVRNATYRAVIKGAEGEEITEGTATRDLKHLVAAGLLRPEGERRGRFYLGTEQLLAMRHEIIKRRNVADNRDPFDTA
jgi:Fic family protein